MHPGRLLHQTSTNTPDLPLLCRPVGNGCSRRSADLPPKMSPKLLFLSLKFRTDERNLRDVHAGKFILMSASVPPPMLLQRWFSISSATKKKRPTKKSPHHLESRGCHPSIRQSISTPSTLLVFCWDRLGPFPPWL